MSEHDPTTAPTASDSHIPAAPDGETVGDLTVAELRDWLRQWVATATGMPVDQISDDRNGGRRPTVGPDAQRCDGRDTAKHAGAQLGRVHRRPSVE